MDMTTTPRSAEYHGNGTVKFTVGYTDRDPADLVQINNISITATSVNAQAWRSGLDEVVTSAGYSVVPNTDLRNGICGNREDVRLEGSPLMHLITAHEPSKQGIREIYLTLDADAYKANIEHVDNLRTLLSQYIAAHSPCS